MRKRDLLRRRALHLLLILAWVALGTVMVVLQPKLWVWFAAISYGIAIIYIVAEVLTWRHAMRWRPPQAAPSDQGPPAPGEGSGPTA